ncbi:MAG: hypothetical protein MUE52_12010 [Tabrizicola sp.]|jgi:hypothetical protein|nr:hypothetical protein [Tabrizicola sp.]
MPLFLQALPLSLKTFWRYLAILPALGIVAALLLLATFIPVVGFFVPGMVYAYCILTGFRCALGARGHDTDPGFGYLLTAGLTFSVLTMIVGFIVRYLAGYLSAGIMLALRAADLGSAGTGSALLWLGSAIGLTVIFMLVWSAALAVPMIAAVAGNGRDGTGLHPLRGVGTGIFGLTLIAFVWLIGGNMFAVFGEVATMFFLLIETIRAVTNAEDPAWDWSLSPFSLLGGTLWMAWASSWFFSAAVLYWERQTAREAASQRARIEARRVSGDDLRALREGRMQRGSDQQAP